MSCRWPLSPPADSSTASPLVVVLDDAHLLTDVDVLGFLDRWLWRAGGSVRLVLSARSDPLLPLHRYRLAGMISEIRVADLSTTPAEAGQLLALHGVRLPDRDIATLTRRTEGWIAGISLSAMRMEGSSRPGDFVTEVALDEVSIGEYLMEEVLDRQPDDTRRVLIDTSFLDVIDGELAAAITGVPTAWDLLSELCRSNSFVTPADPASTSFRYHQLLREILRYLLHREPEVHRRELLRRTSRWYRNRGDLLTAVHYAAEADDHPMAAQLIVNGALAQAVVSRTQLPSVDAAPLAAAHSVDAQPFGSEFAIAAAALHIARGEFGSAREQLNRLPDDARDERGEVGVTVDLIRLLLARSEHAVADVDEAAGRLLVAARETDRPGLAAAARLAQAMTHFYAGAHASVEPTLRAAAADADAAHRPALQLECLSELAHVNSFWARFRTSRSYARQANQLIRMDSSLLAPAALLLAAAHRTLIEGRLSVSVKAERRARAMARNSHDADLHAHLDLVRAAACLAGGRAHDARAALLEHTAPPPGLTRDYRLAALAVSELRIGHPGLALQLLDGHHERPPAAIVCLARAYTDLQGRDVDAAENAIRPILTAAGVPTIRPVLVAALVVAAAIAAARGDADGQAAENVARAVELAGRDVVLPFLGTPEALRDIIARHPLLAAQWVGPIGLAVEDAKQGRSSEVEPLTDKEAVVLRYLATSKSTREIAAELELSVNTVKSHIAAIYRKLHTSGRHVAVIRARQLELL